MFLHIRCAEGLQAESEEQWGAVYLETELLKYVTNM